MRFLSYPILLLALAMPALAAVVAPGTYTGKGASSPLTTKGDIFTYDTADARKGVGANGTIITADSTQAVGWKWAAAGAGTGNVTDINADATAVQTLTVGTTGTDFAIVDDAAGDHKFNLPSASATARGVVTTGSQTIAGAKTFSGAGVFSSTLGVSGIFTGAAGSAAAPSIVGSGATTTGLYFGTGGSGDQLGFSVTGAVQALMDIGFTSYTTASSTAAYELLRGVNTGSLRLYGGAGATAGNIQMFGASHATKSGRIEFQANDIDALQLGASGTGLVRVPTLTASKPVFTDANKDLTSSGTVPFSQISLTGLVEDLHGLIPTASDTTYPLIQKNRVARQVKKIALRCATSGTVTAKLQIDGVDITTCTAISVSNTESDTTCDTGSSNDLALDTTLTLVTSSNSSCLNLDYSIETTRD